MLPNFDFQQYKDFYLKYGKTIDQMNKPKNPLSENKLWEKYKKYLKKLEKQNNKNRIDEKWFDVVQKVKKRDGVCQLWCKLSEEEKNQVLNLTGNFLLDKLDPAHVFGKGSYPHMKYDTDNIVLLSRLFHSRLDHFYNPVTGKAISREEQINWWKRIIGNDLYNILLKRSKNG